MCAYAYMLHRLKTESSMHIDAHVHRAAALTAPAMQTHELQGHVMGGSARAAHNCMGGVFPPRGSMTIL